MKDTVLTFPQEPEAKERFTRCTSISIRLTPRLRYLVELAAREDQRTMSGFIEHAITRALYPSSMVDLASNDDAEVEQHLYLSGLWDVDPSDRFILLASSRPDLLTDDELRLWKRITEDGSLRSSIDPENLDRVKIRKQWPDILKGMV